MKLITSLVIVLLVSVSVSAQVRWDGGGDGVSWNNPNNWDGNVVPVATDDVILDNTFVFTSYTVNIPDGNVTVLVNSLTITPDPGENITLIIPPTNIASPGLSVTGPGDALILDNGAFLINSTGAGVGEVGLSISNTFRINNGGHYIHRNIRDNSSIVSQLSTAPGTELGIFEYDVPSTLPYNIAAGGQNYGTLQLTSNSSGSSTYVISSGTGTMTVRGDLQVTTNTTFRNSTAIDILVARTLSVQASATVDVSGGTASPALQVQGNIAIAGTITETGTGSPTLEMIGSANQTLAINSITGDDLDLVIDKPTGTVVQSSNIYLPDDFILQSGTLNLSSGAASTVLGVKGDFTMHGLLTETGSGSPSVELNGTTNQVINAPGAIVGDKLDFKLNNPAGATLIADLMLPYYFTIASGNLWLGNFSLTTSYVSQLSSSPANNHIVTNGSGFLIIPNVGAAQAYFPVGVDGTSINPVEISNGGGLTYYVRVEQGVNPAIANPLLAVDRTWTINTSPVSAPASPANITFTYYNGQGRAGFDYSSKTDVGQHLMGAWNIIGNNILPAVNGGEYRVSSSVASFNTPFIVGVHGAILPIDFFIVCKGLKKADAATISWEIGNDESVSSFEVEKSLDNLSFKTIASVSPETKKLDYRIDDNALESGSNLYRIKTILLNGKIKYSNTVAILNKVKQILITAVSPNPVQTSTRITVSAPAATTMRFVLTDVAGRAIKQWQQSLSDGNNTINLQMDNFTSGVYFISGTNGEIKMKPMRIVKQ